MMSSLLELLVALLLATSAVSAIPTSERNETLVLEARANTCAQEAGVDPKVWYDLNHYAHKLDLCENLFGTNKWTTYAQTKTEYSNQGVTVTINRGPCAGYTTKTVGTTTSTEYEQMPPITKTTKVYAVIATTCPGVTLTQKFPQIFNDRMKALDLGPACNCQNFETETQIATTITIDKASAVFIYETVPVCTMSTYAKTIYKTSYWEVTKTQAPRSVPYTSCPSPLRTGNP